MATSNEILAWAEQAVEEFVLAIDDSVADVWREVTPDALGLDNDNWLEASKQIIIRFNELADGVTSISINGPSRLPYRTKDLIEFVGLIIDAAQQVA